MYTHLASEVASFVRGSEAYRNDKNYEKILFLHSRRFLELLQRRDFVRNEFHLFQRRLYVF